MGIIVDTNVWAAVERGALRPEDVAVVSGDEPIYLTPTVLAELWYGVHRARTDSERKKQDIPGLEVLVI